MRPSQYHTKKIRSGESKLEYIYLNNGKWYVRATGGAVFGWFMNFEDAIYWYAIRFDVVDK